jgi:hypothetical protein
MDLMNYNKMKKHYGHFLSCAGNPVKYQSQDIETLLIKKERLEKELRELEQLIEKKEKDFALYISEEWTDEEIQEAKEKAYKSSY